MHSIPSQLCNLFIFGNSFRHQPGGPVLNGIQRLVLRRDGFGSFSNINSTSIATVSCFFWGFFKEKQKGGAVFQTSNHIDLSALDVMYFIVLIAHACCLLLSMLLIIMHVILCFSKRLVFYLRKLIMFNKMFSMFDHICQCCQCTPRKLCVYTKN